VLKGFASLVQVIHYCLVYKHWDPALRRVREEQVEMVARWMALLVVKLGVEVGERPEQLTEVVEEVPRVMHCAGPAQNEQPERQSRAGPRVELVVVVELIVKVLEGGEVLGWRGLLMEVAGDQMVFAMPVEVGLFPVLGAEEALGAEVHLEPWKQ
jgi:hypothetical protein